MKAKLSSKGQVVIPSSVRKKLHLHSGNEFQIELKDKTIELKLIESNIEDFFAQGKGVGKEVELDIDTLISKAIEKNDRC